MMNRLQGQGREGSVGADLPLALLASTRARSQCSSMARPPGEARTRRMPVLGSNRRHSGGPAMACGVSGRVVKYAQRRTWSNT